MASQGYTGLVDMRGGMHGAYDRSGALIEAGWNARGYEQVAGSAPERTWNALQ